MSTRNPRRVSWSLMLRSEVVAISRRTSSPRPGLRCVEEGDDVVRRVAGLDVDVAIIKRRESAIQRIVVQAQLGVDVEGDDHPFVVVVDGVVATAGIAAMVDEGSQRGIDRGHARKRRNSRSLAIEIHHRAEELLGGIDAGAGQSKKFVVSRDAFANPQSFCITSISQVGLAERRRLQPANIPGVKEFVRKQAQREAGLGGIDEDIRAEAADAAGRVLQSPVRIGTARQDEGVVFEGKLAEDFSEFFRDLRYFVGEMIYFGFISQRAIDKDKIEGSASDFADDPDQSGR